MYFCIIYVLYTYVFLHCKIIHICKYNKKYICIITLYEVVVSRIYIIYILRDSKTVS